MVSQRLVSLTMDCSTLQKHMPNLQRTIISQAAPYFPQRNGEAERAVGTVKNLLNKSDDPYFALLAYRATPLQNGYNPSELLMCRMLCTTVLSIRSQRVPKVPDSVALKEKDKHLKKRQKQNLTVIMVFESYHP